jgi:hypothetical protein
MSCNASSKVYGSVALAGVCIVLVSCPWETHAATRGGGRTGVEAA